MRGTQTSEVPTRVTLLLTFYSVSESEIACCMCVRSMLSASLGSFIFFNKSKLGSHFTGLSVLLCLIQIEIIGEAQAPPPASGGLVMMIYLHSLTVVTMFAIH